MKMKKEKSEDEKLKERLLKRYFSGAKSPLTKLREKLDKETVTRLRKEIGTRLDGLKILVFNKYICDATDNVKKALSGQGATVTEITSLDDISNYLSHDVLVVDSSGRNPVKETLSWIKNHEKEIMQFPLRILTYTEETDCPEELEKYFHKSERFIQSYENPLRSPNFEEIVNYWKSSKKTKTGI